MIICNIFKSIELLVNWNKSYNMYLALACLVILLTYCIIKRRKYLRQFDVLKSLPGWLPIVGHYMIIKEREELLERSVNLHKIYGKSAIVYAGFEPILITMDSKLISVVLGSTSLTKKSVEYTYFKRWFGDGLLTSTGIKWASHRKILTPAFHYNILEDFVDTFEKKGIFLINNLTKELGKDSFNVSDPITLYTLDVICETAMGTSVDAQNNPNHEYNKAVKIYCDIISKRTVSPFHRVDFLYKLTSWYKDELKAANILKKFSTDIISQRRKVFKQQSNDAKSEKRPSTFVDILMQSVIDGEYLSDEDIREEIDTFLFEGHDTTSIALSMILYSLAKYPDIQKKTYEEITSIFGDAKIRPARIDDLQNLKYLEMVIKESLRLYPSVAIHGRMILEEKKVDDLVLPKGLIVLINQYGLHHDPEVFPDPQSFIPERFTIDNQAERHPYAYIPFSAGPRNCIGQKFAMLELKSAISKILRNFEVLPATPFFQPIFYSVVTTQSANGVKIALKNRIRRG